MAVLFEIHGKSCHIIIAICAYSKYVEGAVLDTNDAYSIANFIHRDLYCRYMAPAQVLVVDKEFDQSNIVKELNESFNVKVNVVRGRPQPNGQVYVVMRTLKERINARLSMHSDFFFIILLFSKIL